MKMSLNKCLSLLSGLLLMAGLFFASTVSAVQNEYPDYSGEWITYKDASLQTVVGTPGGLWHQATTQIDGRSNVWYYGQEPGMNYDVGKTSGSLTMEFDVPLTNPTLYFDHKYETEGGTSYDQLKVKVGSNILWQRKDAKSLDANKNFAWVSEAVDMSSYAGSKETITFEFNSVDSVANNYFGWAIDNVTVGTPSASSGSTTVTTTGGNLKIKQIDSGNFPSIDMFVSVKDDNGNFVTGLTEKDFTVKENASLISPITVTPISSNAALKIGITIDRSGSMGSSGMASAKTAVKDFIDMSTGSKNEFAVVTFETSVQTVQDFTTDKQMLKNAVDSIKLGNMTALYKGIIQTLNLMPPDGVRAVIAFTDGKNNQGSNPQEVIDLAKQKNVPVYTIGIGNVDKTDLQKIATQTGGQYSDADFNNLSAIYQSLQSTILQQYQINFESKSSLVNDRCYDLEVTIPNGSVYTATECISGCACNPPVISLHDDTKKLMQAGNAPAFGDPVEIKALVTDSDNDPITAHLYYRAVGAGANTVYNKMQMTVSALSSDLYTATIPGTDYADPGVEFYVSASDGTFAKESKVYEIPSTTGPSVEQIYILSPTNNAAMDIGTTNGKSVFSWTKLSGVAKYVLTLELDNLLAANSNPIAIPMDLIPPSSGTSTSVWGGTSTTGSPNFVESILGMEYTLSLDASTWDILALYGVKWGVQAFDSAGNLIGSTYDQGAPAKVVSSLKYLASNAIAMTSPQQGTVLDHATDSAPVFKWNTYTGVVEYAVALAHVSSLGFDKMIIETGLTLNLFTMDQQTWQTMPSGTWYWAVFGYDVTGKSFPTGFNLFEFIVQ